MDDETVMNLKKAFGDLSQAMEDAVASVIESISAAFDHDMGNARKYVRRVEYHRRLSERNRLHPKRKPKGGR